jgi:hypothetical protein
MPSVFYLLSHGLALPVFDFNCVHTRDRLVFLWEVNVFSTSVLWNTPRFAFIAAREVQAL